MQLSVFHRTRYHYRSPVRDSYNELRLRPATADAERLQFFLLNVHPPVRLRHFRDDYYNYVHYFELAEPHYQLTVEAQSTINTTSQYADGLPLGVPFSNLAGPKADVMRPFLDSSRYVSIDADLWKLAIDISHGQEGVFESAQAIMAYIHTHWEYAPNTTSASTHLREVMATKRGVCQDFTHVMIGLCRALHIPARYVSGYLYNGPEDVLKGAQASHAWCEIYVPEKGWYGLDPTNNVWADERHLKIATGRDYHDAAPVSGHFDGPPGASSGIEEKLQVEMLGP